MVQVSVGTLLAFTMVAISVLILRFVPPDELPLPSSLQERIESVSNHIGTSSSSQQPLISKNDASIDFPVIKNQEALGCCKLQSTFRLVIAFFMFIFSKFLWILCLLML